MVGCVRFEADELQHMVGRQHFTLDLLAKRCRRPVLDNGGGGLEGLPGNLGVGRCGAFNNRTANYIGQ